MNEIHQLTEGTNDLNNNQIIEILNWVGKEGDIIIIKNDGVRTNDNFTVLISSPQGKFDSIRYDANSLSSAMKKAVSLYVSKLK